jgi:hypothetical protein
MVGDAVLSPELRAMMTAGRPSVALVGCFDRASDTEAFIYRALERSGVTCLMLREEFYSQAEAAGKLEGFDVVIFVKGRFRDSAFPKRPPLEFIERCRDQGSVVCCWLFDLLTKEWSADRYAWAVKTSTFCNVFFTTDGYFARHCDDLSNVEVLRQGIPDDWREGKVLPRYKSDFLFLGVPYRERIEFVKTMTQLYGTRFQMGYDCPRGAAVCDACESAKLIVDCAWPRFDYYWSDRVYVVAGAGGCFLAPPIPGMAEEGWIPGKNFLAYDADVPLEQQVDRFEFYAADEDWRGKIRTEAARFSREHHTYDCRIRQLLTVLDSKGLLNK